MPFPRKRKCRHCCIYFLPDPRNAEKQEYCSLLECRKASKVASQKKWLSKPENRNYFCGPANVQRVQQWRKENPGYWRKKATRGEPLQDHSIKKESLIKEDKTETPCNALQDLLLSQNAVFLGLLAQLSGSALQDDIVITGRRLRQLGQDILSQPFYQKGGQHDDQQTPRPSTHDPPNS